MRKPALLAAILCLGILLGALVMGASKLGNFFGGGPDPETIAAASLESMREQARLTAFAASYVAVITSTQNRFGLEAKRTMIMPGSVRYEVDLAKLGQEDVRWNEAGKTLSITLPPLEISAPQVNLDGLQEYGDGGVLSALTNSEDRLDAANRQRGQQELVRQARQPLPMRLARDAAKRAVARSFAMPLRAAGVEANVEVRFEGDARNEPSYLDASRRMEDVLKERQAGRQAK